MQSSSSFMPRRKEVDWDTHGQRLADISRRYNYGPTALSNKLASKGYLITPRIVYHRLKKYGISQYLLVHMKEELLQQVLDADGDEALMPRFDARTRDRLKKYIKGREGDGEVNDRLLQLLKDMKITTDAPPTLEQSSSSEEEDFDFLDDLTAEPSDIDLDFLEPSIDSQLSQAFATLLPGPHQSPVSLAASQLCSLSKQFYDQKLYKDPPPNAIAFSLDYTFWSNMRQCLYYFKKRDPTLAMQNFTKAIPLLPDVCQAQPLGLLKEFFATLSCSNTSIQPEVRKIVLDGFYNCASTSNGLGPRHAFTQLCRIMLEQENAGTDETCIAVLEAMRDSAESVLSDIHPERFQLSRAITRLYRRCALPESAPWNAAALRERADWNAQNLVLLMSGIFGNDHLQTRAAMTERVHILSDGGRHEEALEYALDIHSRGERDRADNPDERCIYTMEDVSFQYDKLGRLDDAVVYLQKALRAAVKLWQHSNPTTHIMDKLFELQEKRVQEAKAKCTICEILF